MYTLIETAQNFPAVGRPFENLSLSLRNANAKTYVDARHDGNEIRCQSGHLLAEIEPSGAVIKCLQCNVHVRVDMRGYGLRLIEEALTSHTATIAAIAGMI